MHAYSRDVLFGRMVGIISQNELDLLRDKTVAIPGCGGVGFTHAETLARSGVGCIHISDFDAFGPENMNRQFGATVSTIGKNKVDVLADRLSEINPELKIVKFDGVKEQTLYDFLSGVDIICDAMDYFIIEPRLALHRAARKLKIPVINTGPIGFGAILHLYDPLGMTFEDYFDIKDELSNDEKIAKFGRGIGPAHLYRYYQKTSQLDFETRKVASLSCSCLLATALLGSAVLPILLRRPSYFKPIPYSYHFDPQAGQFVELYIPGGVAEIDANPSKFFS